MLKYPELKTDELICKIEKLGLQAIELEKKLKGLENKYKTKKQKYNKFIILFLIIEALVAILVMLYFKDLKITTPIICLYPFFMIFSYAVIKDEIYKPYKIEGVQYDLSHCYGAKANYEKELIIRKTLKELLQK